MTVGERLREARERQKVSLHAIAEKTNISVRFLDAIEKNHKLVGRTDSFKLCVLMRGAEAHNTLVRNSLSRSVE